MGYVPRAVTQVKRSDPCWTTSCWAAVGGWMAAGASRGRRHPDVERFRRKAGVQVCRPGSLEDVKNGLLRITVRDHNLWTWGDGRLVEDLDKAELRARLLNANSERLWAIPTDFEVWDDEASVCQPGFNDPAEGDSYHMIGVVAGEGTGRNEGKLRVLNPLCSTLKWVPIETVMRAARRYAVEHPGRIDALSIKPPEELRR